ncbi:S8 family serine peptidase [bacterium SCSIO 12643]|nr:S8 family serine peptidase [bacterium SCSIO 12643]
MNKFLPGVMLGVILFATTQLFGNNHHLLKLKSGNYTVESNIKDLDFKQFEKSKYNGYYYLLLNFNSIPTNDMKRELFHAGVELLDYLPHNTFLSKIKMGVGVDVLDAYDIYGVLAVEPKHKLSYDLSIGRYPEHALNGKKIQVVVKHHPDISGEEMDRFYRSLGASIKGHYEFSSLTTVEINIDEVIAVAKHPLVKYIEPIAPEAVPEDVVGQSNHRTNYISNPTINNVPYNGEGVWLAIGDDGELGPHIDYAGRMDQSSAGPSTGNHGDHVGGIMMGAGNVDPDARGMAWGADIKVYDVWDAVNSTPTSYFNPGVVVTSTSYGNGCNAGYTGFAQTADQQVRTMPNLMHVFSAGNSGSSDCGYGAGSGWGNITGGIKAGKNVLAVGNVTFTDGLANSSSRGPASDGRIKPDICANGTQVYSCFPNNQYVNNTGTSMAAPGVSGTYGALVHAYRELNGGVTPPSALIKGAMLNTADDLGNVGPDFKFGWGRLNARKVLEVFENNTYMLDSISQSGSNQHSIVVPTGVKQMKVMIYWNDYEASASASQALVNNIDMGIATPAPNQQYLFPYVLDPTPNPTNLDLPATYGTDSLNNMEQIVVDNPASGTYNVLVSGVSIPQGPQKYYIIYEFITEDIIVTYPTGGEHFATGTMETIRWDAPSGTNSFTIEYSTDNGVSWTQISNSVNADRRYYNWTVPAWITGDALIRVSRNGVTGQSMMPFNMIGVPTNLSVVSSCPNEFELSWDPVSGATEYEVSVLGNKYMDSVTTVSTTSAVLTGYSALNTYWVSVRAKANGVVGKRAYAIEKTPGVWNCVISDDIELSLLAPSGNALFDCYSISNQDVQVRLKNNGTQAVNTVDLSYQFNATAVNSETYTGTISPGDSVDFTFSQTISIPSIPIAHSLVVWKDIPDGNPLNDTVRNAFEVYSGTTINLPYIEDFETFNNCATTNNCGLTQCPLIAGWTNVENGVYDDIDFRVNNGTTPSQGTGPSMDQAPGTSFGKYLYLEASGSCDGMESQLYSPCIDLTNSAHPEMSVWYHMNGAEMGELHFDVYANNTWNNDVVPMISGDNGNLWKEQKIDLSSYVGGVVTIRFRGITGSGWRSDIAIDHFSVIENGIGILADTMPCFADGAVTINNTPITGGTNYTWNFGTDANPATASTAGPHTVTYSSKGMKTIQLSVTVNGTVESTSLDIQLVDLPVSSFTSVYNSSNNTVEFTNTSQDYASSLWDFGDGNTSTLDNPVHTYAAIGYYDVTLTTTNSCGDHVLKQKIENFPLGVTGIGRTDYGILVYPNPASDQLTLQVNGAENGEGEVVIYDIKGNQVYRDDVEINSGRQEYVIDLKSLSKGVYVLSYKSNQFSDKLRVVIQ